MGVFTEFIKWWLSNLIPTLSSKTLTLNCTLTTNKTIEYIECNRIKLDLQSIMSCLSSGNVSTSTLKHSPNMVKNCTMVEAPISDNPFSWLCRLTYYGQSLDALFIEKDSLFEPSCPLVSLLPLLGEKC